MQSGKPTNASGDFWGGFAAMLVALPSAIAFGVTIFAPLGGELTSQGALAGILGTAAVGFLAAALGGTSRLISAPCAPAAAILSAFTVEQVARGTPAANILLLLTGVTLLCGVFQVLFGAIRLGTLIKYMPYPVVSGYLTGVGLIIIGSQLPRWLGTHGPWWQAIGSPSDWQWQALTVGAVTMLAMVAGAKFIKIVPAAILALAAGVTTYFGLSYFDPSLLQLHGNKLVVGPLAGSGAGFVANFAIRLEGLRSLELAQVAALIIPALTLAVLLSIDTLKTCVVVDALTRTRHKSNRELIAQGVANTSAAIAGGVPGAGTMGATLVNISSGGSTRRSGLIEGALAIVAFLLLGKFIAWVPIAALAGILIVIGVRMFDRKSLHLLRSRSTVLDFLVIVIVTVVAVTVGLIAASGAGIALAILLFLREQIGGSIVRRMLYGNQMFSKQMRLPEEVAVLEKCGDRTVIFELQGSLFFGTADQLFAALEPELMKRKYIILDMRHVQSVDVTAAHMLQQVERSVRERGGYLILSHLPLSVPTGQDMERYFGETGLVKPEHQVLTFGHRDEALEWVENQILAEELVGRNAEQPLELHEIELLKGRKPDTLESLRECMELRSYKPGETIFKIGSESDELFLIRRGLVRVMLPLDGRTPLHLATFGRGDFFGEMAFLDRQARSANAEAYSECEVFVLSRSRFDQLAEQHKRLSIELLASLARALAARMRRTNREIYTLHNA